MLNKFKSFVKLSLVLITIFSTNAFAGDLMGALSVPRHNPKKDVQAFNQGIKALYNKTIVGAHKKLKRLERAKQLHNSEMTKLNDRHASLANKLGQREALREKIQYAMQKRQEAKDTSLNAVKVVASRVSKTNKRLGKEVDSFIKQVVAEENSKVNEINNIARGLAGEESEAEVTVESFNALLG